MRRAAVALAVGVALAAATLSTTLGLLFYRPLPTIDGHYRLVGLHERAEVVRDVFGVPRIYARDLHDLFFLQGYVTAQDRFAQMEDLRATSRGVFTELVAPLDVRLTEAASAYADGVSKFLSQHVRVRALPGEVVLGGRRPEPWTSDDVLRIASVHLRRVAAASACVSVPADAARRGMPLLAADSYLEAAAPGWYEVGLHSDALRAVGIALPGVPGIMVGHNGWMAWAALGDGSAHPYQTLGAVLEIASTRGVSASARASGLTSCISGRSAVVSGDASRRSAIEAALATRELDLERLRSAMGRPGYEVGARLLIDLADVDTSRSAVSHGASAHRSSPHYGDQAPLWKVGQTHRMPFTRGAVGRTDGELVFRAR